jgi:hypothetical protein
MRCLRGSTVALPQLEAEGTTGKRSPRRRAVAGSSRSGVAAVHAAACSSWDRRPRHRYGAAPRVVRSVLQRMGAGAILAAGGSACANALQCASSSPADNRTITRPVRFLSHSSSTPMRACTSVVPHRHAKGTVGGQSPFPRSIALANPLSRQWPGTESNRRHADFQSAALPTELPGRRRGV